MPQSAAYKEDVSFEPEYQSIATLADESVGLTCSVTVGRAWARGRANTVVGYPEFELAAETVRTGEHNLLLVPAAYSNIRNFFFDSSLRAIDAFLHQLPDMVFAIPNTERADRLETVFHHPATESLVQQLPNDGWSAVHASSNSAACRAALERPGPRVR